MRDSRVHPQRRQVLLGSAGAAAASWLGLPALGAPAQDDRLDVHIELHAVPDEVSIRPGKRTRVWRYRGKLLRGDASALEASAGGYLGPIIRVRRGQRVRIDLINGLPESTIVHWHGLHVPEAMDGHPRFAVPPGRRYRYAFTVNNRAGSYWFHPHPHGRTGKQVYAGLAGLFIVSDEEEDALDLPRGAQDLPLVIQDRNFGTDNQFEFPGAGRREGAQRSGGMMGRGMMGSGMGGAMARITGVLGDAILVNGSVDAQVDVERSAYRLRLLNASNMRTYKLAWSDRSPLTVIGTDGGLLGAALERDYVMLAPAERIDLWVDFGRWEAKTELALQSLSFESGMGMGSMMQGFTTLPDGAPFTVLRVRVGAGARTAATAPGRLPVLPPAQPRLAVNFDRPKVFDLTMGMMRWGINGNSFEMLEATQLETVQLGTQEIWEFRNEGRSGMMGMAMAHSMHVHGLQFRILGRFGDAYDSIRDGLVDEGWKDTVLVMPGERVRILVRFADYAGLFLYHCHMLEHEDAGLMRNYRVEA